MSLIRELLGAQQISPQCLQHWPNQDCVEFLLWFSCNRTELWLATLQTFIKFGKQPGVCHAAVFAHRMNNRANSGDLSKDLLHLIMQRNAIVWMLSQDCIACFVVGVDGAFQRVEEEFE